MKQVFRKYFVPHEDNHYHPHILHTKRAIFYSFVFVLMKSILFFSIAFLPITVFTLPEILVEQQVKIITLTNSLRDQLGHSPLIVNQKLTYSSDLKAQDMVRAQYFSHVGPENRNLAYFLGQAGYAYRVAGENLGMGFMDADSVVAAWVNSPTHYQNIIDTDFVEIGVNLAEGIYKDVSTVFAVQHFGTPKQVIAPALVETVVSSTETVFVSEEVIEEFPVSIPEPTSVRSSDISSAEEFPSSMPVLSVHYDELGSYVHWEEYDRDSIRVEPFVLITGPVARVSLQVGEYSFELQRNSSDPSMYTASNILPLSKEEVFKTVLPASLVINSTDEEIIRETVSWQNPAIISSTPIQTYTEAKKILPFVSSIVQFTQSVYILFICLFSIALVLSIGIEIRKQHPHVIVQTLALILLLVVLLVA